MRRLFVIFCVIVLPGLSAKSSDNPDSTVTLVEKAKIQAWMTDARHKMYESETGVEHCLCTVKFFQSTSIMGKRSTEQQNATFNCHRINMHLSI